MAKKTGQSFPIALRRTVDAWAEFGNARDLAKLETILQETLKSDQTTQFAFWAVNSQTQLSLVDFYRGNWPAALLHAEARAAGNPGVPAKDLGVGMLFRQMAYAGDHTGAFSSLDLKRARLPRLGQRNPRHSWSMLALVIEGFAMLAESSRAAELYPLARELISTGAVTVCRSHVSRRQSRVSPQPRLVSGTPLKSTFRSQCSRPSPSPIASNKRSYTASTQ